MVIKCLRCTKPHPALHGMTPWDYYHNCANLGKYENPSQYSCQCTWLDSLTEEYNKDLDKQV